MGIVVKQSISNTITTYFGFIIGAINTLFLYTQFLGSNYYGLVGYLLSIANIMSPILMFGVGNTLVKFYSFYTTKEEKDSFLVVMLVLPLIVIIPVGAIGCCFYEVISIWLSERNAIAKDYTWTIFIIATVMAYFEVFFSWVKVHLKSVFGNFMKEVFHRVCIMFLLLGVYLNYLSVQNFIYALVVVYVIRLFVIQFYAFKVYLPCLKWCHLSSFSPIFKYTIFIILVGSVAMFLIDLDKFMLGKLVPIDNIAYYNVAIFISMVISAPSRAMHQITNPLTANFLNKKQYKDLKELYQKSSLNLLVISGLLFTVIVTNINQMYYILPEHYSKGFYAVVLVGVVKLYNSALGTNNAILFNSDYYKIMLFTGVAIVIIAVVLNLVLIPIYGITGAAMATFTAFFMYDTIKLWYVNYKMKLQPFTKQTLYVTFLIISLSLIFFFIEFPFTPWINILIKSMCISGIYGIVVIKARLSKTILGIVNRLWHNFKTQNL